MLTPQIIVNFHKFLFDKPFYLTYRSLNFRIISGLKPSKRGLYSLMKKSTIYLNLVIAVYALLVFITFFNYVIFLHLFAEHYYLVPHIFFAIASYFMVFLGTLVVALIFAFYREIYLFDLKKRIIYIYFFFYPIILILSKLFKIRYQKLQLGFVDLNNSWVIGYLKTHKPKRILFETPICLQSQDCPLNVISDLNHCKECGKCQVCDLRKLSREFDVKAAIFTGSQLAIKLVKDFKPDVIVAIACEKEIMEDIPHIYPYMAYGIVNIRNNGPCLNTRFDYAFARNLFKLLIGEVKVKEESPQQLVLPNIVQ